VLRTRRIIVLLITFTAPACMGATEPAPSDSIDAVRGSLEKWVETRKVISREKQDWVLAREMLQERIGLVQREISSLREKTTAAEKSISDTHKPLTQRLPEKPDETKLSLAQRFQNVIGILNEINKFNREITVKSELLTLSDGTAAEVTALYVGLGQAYYTGAKGTVAGIGRPGKDGWVWIPANEAAGPISDAIAILNNEKGAVFLLLPFEIQQ